MADVIEKYLCLYGESECRALEGFPAHYKHCLVLPLYRESPQALGRFCHTASQQGHTLIIAVINRPDNDDNQAWAIQINDQLIAISDQACAIWHSHDHSTLWSLDNHSGLLIVDRCIEGDAIPVKQGVGLARKIGADIACALIQRGNINSQWIHNSDGDAHLADDYFLSTEQLDIKKHAAACYPFKHVFLDNSVSQLPTKVYEFSLHYYVAALQWAGSYYAYHTIGSIIVINHNHYAQVRGFPKRSGAEDFYLLNKLAKLGDIHNLRSKPIHIEARQSDRVPFGTGPAVKKLAAIEDAKNISLYHPKSFQQLRIFHLLIKKLAQQTTLDEALNNLQTVLRSLSGSAEVNATLLIIIDKICLKKALMHAFKQAKTAHNREAQLKIWFDSFITLKFIHHSRDISAATVNVYQLQELIEQERNAIGSFGQQIIARTDIDRL